MATSPTKNSASTRNEYLFALPECIESRITVQMRDTRDVPLMRLLANIILTTVPAALLVLFYQSHILGLMYLTLNTVLYLEPFLLALHFSTHRPIFRNRFLNGIAPNFIAPLFGIPPMLYRSHHVYMHHEEENAYPSDLTSTEHYQRDSILHFMCYWARFACLTWIELPLYISRTRGKTSGLVCITRILFSFILYVVIFYLRPVAAFWTLIAPAILSSVALSFGNWCQHIFVRAPHNGAAYDITFSIIQSFSNSRNFNDGYHAEHHLRPGVHWSELPDLFEKSPCNTNRIVFRNTSFFEIGICVFREDYATLTMKFVPMALQGTSRIEVESLLRSRLLPYTADIKTKKQ